MDTQQRREYWKQQIANWRQSGKGVLRWCLDNKIHQSTFWYWRTRLEGHVSTVPKSPQKVSFSELSDAAELSSGIEILVNGLAIRLHKNFDETTLKSCLRLLGK